MSESRKARKIFLPILLLVCGHVSVCSHAAAETRGGRYALVIGNSKYNAFEHVSGAKSAASMAESLEMLGFETPEVVENGEFDEIEKALGRLESRIRKASASVVVVFFSGHGFEKDNTNYLMPIDGTLDPESNIPLDMIQRTLAAAPDAVKLVFLDTCRTIKNGTGRGIDPKKAPSLHKTLYAFSAGPNEKAAASSPDGHSVYSWALLQHIREPGLSINDLLNKVNERLKGLPQTPASVFYESGNEVSGFYLEPPVILQVEIEQADDSLIVLLNGKVEMNGGPGTKANLELKAGRNDLVLLVYNERVLHNGQTWGRTEGWSYSLVIKRDGREIRCGPERCFEDRGERVPFKNGPRHGKVFTVAYADLCVGMDLPTLAIENRDLRVWERGAPVWANDQGLLDARSLKELDLSPEDLLEDVDLGPLEFMRFVIADFLKTGKFLGKVVTDPDDTVFTVRGNRGLEKPVVTCMTKRREDRIRDLKKSIQLARERHPMPFESYDQGLMKCLEEEGKDSGFKPEDMRVTTAVETRRSLCPQ